MNHGVNFSASCTNNIAIFMKYEFFLQNHWTIFNFNINMSTENLHL